MGKVCGAIVLVVLVAFATGHEFEDGLIKCTDAYKEGVNYRDINDATIYWICPAGKEFGVRMKCPENHGFLEDKQKCVPWQAWYWTEPKTCF